MFHQETNFRQRPRFRQVYHQSAEPFGICVVEVAFLYRDPILGESRGFHRFAGEECGYSTTLFPIGGK
jgi:hypothetical protein